MTASHTKRHFISHEQRLNDQQKQISLVLQGSFPQTEGILFEGQIFDAYVLVSDLVRSANERVILIDNYIDETVLTLLDKRADGVFGKMEMPAEELLSRL